METQVLAECACREAFCYHNYYSAGGIRSQSCFHWEAQTADISIEAGIGRHRPGLAQAHCFHGGELRLWAAKDWDLPLWLQLMFHVILCQPFCHPALLVSIVSFAGISFLIFKLCRTVVSSSYTVLSKEECDDQKWGDGAVEDLVLWWKWWLQLWKSGKKLRSCWKNWFLFWPSSLKGPVFNEMSLTKKIIPCAVLS